MKVDRISTPRPLLPPDKIVIELSLEEAAQLCAITGMPGTIAVALAKASSAYDQVATDNFLYKLHCQLHPKVKP